MTVSTLVLIIVPAVVIVVGAEQRAEPGVGGVGGVCGVGSVVGTKGVY